MKDVDRISDDHDGGWDVADFTRYCFKPLTTGVEKMNWPTALSNIGVIFAIAWIITTCMKGG
jgi:hypothetical protein